MCMRFKEEMVSVCVHALVLRALARHPFVRCRFPPAAAKMSHSITAYLSALSGYYLGNG